MRNLVVIVVIAVCGLLGANYAGTTSSKAATPSASIAHAAPAPRVVPVSLVAPAAPRSTADSEPACEGASVSEDAASCSAGGWVAQLTCCSVSGQALERWKLGSQTKCCGACFLP
jgi:hypothetical protein